MNENSYRFKLATSSLLLHSSLVNTLEIIDKKYGSRQLLSNRDIMPRTDTKTSMLLVLFYKDYQINIKSIILLDIQNNYWEYCAEEISLLILGIYYGYCKV